MEGPQGSMTMTLKLWQADGVWKGQITVGDNTIAVHQLKIQGSQISFITHFGQGDINHTGVLKGDDLSLKITSDMFNSNIVLHRQAAAASSAGAGSGS